MPPRYAYWTIIAGGLPTAFRAAERDELMPTFTRLREKHPDAEMRWFARGKLWGSPEEARRDLEGRRRDETGDRRERRPARRPDTGRGAADREAPARGRDWRPGGEHRDPRQKYADAKKARNVEHRKRKFSRKHGGEERPRSGGGEERPRPDSDRRATGAGADRFRERPRPPQGRGTTPHHDEGAPRRPWNQHRGSGGSKPQGGWKPRGGPSTRPWNAQGPRPRGEGGAKRAWERPRGERPEGERPRDERRPKGASFHAREERPPKRAWDRPPGDRPPAGRPPGDRPKRAWNEGGHARPPREGDRRQGASWNRGEAGRGSDRQRNESRGPQQRRESKSMPRNDGARPDRQRRDWDRERERGGGGFGPREDRAREPVKRRFERPAFERNQGTEEPSTPPRPRGPNREPRPSEAPEPTPPPRPSEPVTTPPGPPERGRLVKRPRRP